MRQVDVESYCRYKPCLPFAIVRFPQPTADCVFQPISPVPLNEKESATKS